MEQFNPNTYKKQNAAQQFTGSCLGKIIICAAILIVLLIVAALILLFADIYRERGRRVYERICEELWIVRPVVLALGVLFIVVMGVWGSAYQASGFLYFKF